MTRAAHIENAEVLMRTLRNPHIIIALFRALDGLQLVMDRMESIDSGTDRYLQTSVAVAAGRTALKEARGEA
ncbi:MAG TPA: hypothetical protein VNS29_04060 [Burkholderiaceae bacterium]|nr:hypothetical protein [Burkholderiaceae bacterium]